jgi:hypothetical protein
VAQSHKNQGNNPAISSQPKMVIVPTAIANVNVTQVEEENERYW